MFIPQTLDDYMDNPMGKGATAISGRKYIVADLNNRYSNLIRKTKDFKCNVYFSDEAYFFHILIPSESERENTYDVVIELYPEEPAYISDKTLDNYVMRVFSNSPSFVYTYAYVYYNYDLMIKSLAKKYDNITLRDNPVTKNPGEIISYDKSIYFACKFLKSHPELLDKNKLQRIVKPLDGKAFYNSIRNTDTIMLEIKKENEKIKKTKEENRQKIRDSLNKYAESKSKNVIKKITGSKKTGSHKITPHAKITGKPKTKSTIKK